MNKNAFLADSAHKSTETAEGSGRVGAANAEHWEPRVYHAVNRKSFSLTIRADDGSTLLEVRAEYMHQAFQRLIDWSIDEVGQDACATVSGPNGFYANHRIKASRDFSWIESECAVE
jgi:hypothetical protein